MSPRLRRAYWLGLGLGGLFCSVACASAPAKAPNPMRPIDEGRALNIIAASLRSEGLQPEGPRVVTLSNGKKITVDVTVSGRKFGIAFLTKSEAGQLGEGAQDRTQAPSDALVVRTGQGKEADVHVVVLYAEDYQYDDNVGEQHEATMITAESKLDRDARDFVTIVQKNRWP